MKNFTLSISLGLIAAIIDVTPMVIQRIDIYACVSAFIQWVILGFVICHLRIGLRGWLKGFVVTVCMNIPIMVIVAKSEPMSVIPILMMSMILGSTLGYFSDKYTAAQNNA